MANGMKAARVTRVLLELLESLQSSCGWEMGKEEISYSYKLMS